MATVRANQTVSVLDPGGYDKKRSSHNGTRLTVGQDQAFDSDDPVVKEYPWLFTQDNIEQATAAPGEKRNTSRS